MHGIQLSLVSIMISGPVVLNFGKVSQHIQDSAHMEPKGVCAQESFLHTPVKYFFLLNQEGRSRHLNAEQSNIIMVQISFVSVKVL